MRRKAFTEINVVPFIDIVLVLLVIVLATASFIKNKSIEIDVPSGKSKAITEDKAYILSVDANGTYYFDKNAQSFANIEAQIAKLNPKKDTLTLQIDKKADFEKFFAVIDSLKEKRFEKVNIIRE